MKKGIVIAGFSGVGKTVLGTKYKNVLDLDAAEYVYDDSDCLHIPFEKRKGEKRKLNSSWPQNYIVAIQDALYKYDFILVWDREDIIREYMKNDIAFILCYPSREDLSYYVERYRSRGNTEKYISWKLAQYDEKVKFFETLSVPKIILDNRKTLEDYLKEKHFSLIKR